MQTLINKQLLDFLEHKEKPQGLRNDLIVCYPKQVPVGAIWLVSGGIRTHYEKKNFFDYNRPGLYLFDEFSKNQRVNYSVKILKGSVIWPVTRSVLEEFLQHA